VQVALRGDCEAGSKKAKRAKKTKKEFFAPFALFAFFASNSALLARWNNF
jgi:hypothetical protein